MTTSKRLLDAGAALRERMLIFKRTAQQAREISSMVELQPEELWEVSDDAAVAEWEAALAEATGQRRLPLEV